ncbi:FUSC family protein [Paenibacillus sp. MMS20-IR301]|uniref:FUSC family protein n=1 Tax=Paenibacillus sp. MMS20-IR301 TaxID=2895946 RepID=UPI0028F0E633|nr:FUSC family protein [Paenibacillus sp. MMS20-IR301]WNS42489.1 FUSC family protein [Paenibacillus sp. MMS20-IR301]
MKSMNEGLQDRLEKYGLSLYMIRITLAASLSWVAVHSLYGDHYLYFAPLAAILITQSSVKASLEKGAYRLLGIVLGGIVSLIVGRFFDVGALSILLMLLLGIGVATACRINIQAVSQVGVTSVLALTFYHDGYIVWRVAETLIGVLIALAINMIIVPPKGFVKVKSLALEGSLLLSDALSGLTAGSRGTASAPAALKQSGELLAKSDRLQKELHYTLSHFPCRKELGALSQATSHLGRIHAYVKGIAEEIALLPAHYAAADWMIEVVTATADCIALYGTRTLSDAECGRSLPESLRRARDVQLAWFAELQGECPLAAFRDLGAVFSHLNRILEEIERADYAAVSAAAQPAKANTARAVRFLQKGLSHKL